MMTWIAPISSWMREMKFARALHFILAAGLAVTSLGLVPTALPASAAPFQESDSSIRWNTFLGTAGNDTGEAMAVDDAGNLYVTGTGSGAWGGPLTLNPYAGGYDAYIAKYDSSGALQWNTFLGSASGDDIGKAIALDGSGNLFLAGNSNVTWGDNPLNAFVGSADTFIAKLDGNGALQWNTFLGSTDGAVYSSAISVSESGNAYVFGDSQAAWGSPQIAYAGAVDAYVAKLNSNGALQWNTFLGSDWSENSFGMAIDKDENLYVTGAGQKTWGDAPVNAFAGFIDTFVAKLDSSGKLKWNTFLGSGGSGNDQSRAIVLDPEGNLFLTGYSTAAWGSSPIHAYTGKQDIFVAKLGKDGALQWNTFLGAADEDDRGAAIDLDPNGNLYVAGSSKATWGSPHSAHPGGGDAFVAKLGPSGALLWNTFLGPANMAISCSAMVLDSRGKLYVDGYSVVTWGSPLNPFSGNYDGYVAAVGWPILTLQGKGQDISDGDVSPDPLDGTDFGPVNRLQTAIQSFTFVNSGNAESDPVITISGAQASDFSLSLPPTSPVGPISSTTFTLAFTPSGIGQRQATVSIVDDAMQSPYTFTIQGTGKESKLFLPLVQ